MWVFAREGTVSIGPADGRTGYLCVRSPRAEDIRDLIGRHRLSAGDVEPDPAIRGAFRAFVPAADVVDAIAAAVLAAGHREAVRRVDLFGRETDPDELDFLFGP